VNNGFFPLNTGGLFLWVECAAASGGLLSFALRQQKVTQEKLKSRTQPTHMATTLVYETGFIEPLRG
jgi:hypothetical protein